MALSLQKEVKLSDGLSLAGAGRVVGALRSVAGGEVSHPLTLFHAHVYVVTTHNCEAERVSEHSPRQTYIGFNLIVVLSLPAESMQPECALW